MSASFLIFAFVTIQVISGVFSMFGKGGGSLYTPVLVMLGMAIEPAISTALFLNLVTALTATLVFQRNKLVDYRFCLVFLPGTLAGSFLGAVLSSLIGVGGGLIISPFLVLYMKYGAQMAAGANSLIVTASSLVGTLGHFALGHVDARFLAAMTVACIIGSAAGSHVTVKASPGFVKIAFACIMWPFATQIALKLARVI